MAYLDMKRSSFNDKGKIYSEQFTLIPSEVSDIYLLPDDMIHDVGVAWDSGTPTVEFSFDDKETIKNGNGQFATWDGTSIINTAVTAVKVTNPELTNMLITLTVRTR